MPLQRLGIAPLVGGVSTQPPSNRFQSQTETSDNTLVAINRGLEKRYGSVFISSPDTESGNLDHTGTAKDAKFHAVKRDEDNIYFLLVDKDKSDANMIQAFSADGTKLTVTVKSGDSAAYQYIRQGSFDSQTGLVLKTYGDTTFILNKQVTTALTGDAASYTYQTNSTVTSLPLPPDDTAFTGLTQNSYVHLIQTDVGYAAGYYKLIDKTSETGPWWERAATPLDNSYLDETTMPVQLVYDPSDQSLELSFPEWQPRKSGDSVTNPGPSFIGKALNDLVVFEDRIWLSADQQVVSSQTGDLFNFWVNDWTTVVDSDPIDITLSGSSVNSGEFLIPFNKTLVVFSDGAKQWEIQSLDTFTPSSANLVETTTYDIDPAAYPTQIGNQLYFASDQGNYSFIWEYFPNFDRDSNIGNNISSHVEEYIPTGLRRLVSSENNNMMFAWSEQEPANLYVYTTAWQVSEKQQSAWTRWVLDSSLYIVGHAAFDNLLYLLLESNGDVWLEKMPITPPTSTTDGSITDDDTFALLTEDGEQLLTEDGEVLVLEEATSSGIGYHAHMDRKVSVTGSYSSATKMTTFTCPFEDANIDTVILADQWGDRKGQVIASTNTTTGGVTTLTVSGDFSTYPAILGKSFTMSAQLTRPFVKDQNQIVVQGTTQIRLMDVLFKNTTTFTVEITPRGRPTKTQKYNAARYGSAVFGQTSTDDFGRYRTTVFGSASDTDIVLKNDTPFPSLFTNLEYTLNFVPSRNNPAKR